MHLSRRCTFVITRCLPDRPWSDVVSFLTFSTSFLKLLSGIKGNFTWSKNLMSSNKFVFSWVDRKTKMAVLTSDWLRHFRLFLCNRWTEFNEIYVLYQICVLWVDGKTSMAARPLLAETWDCNRWTAFSETWHDTRSQGPVPSLWFGVYRKTMQDGCPGLWLAEIFDFFSKTAELNSMKLKRKQGLNVHYQFCILRANRKSKMSILASDWRRHIRLFLCNCWTGFNET